MTIADAPVVELAPESSGYTVKLPVFEGPLDLLLHLIRQSEMEITEIPIALVAEQYLQYLEWMRELNLEVAGDYLVMAATLAQIKSRMLLPPDEDEEEDEELDPRAELIARLLEYQRFKEAAEDLGRRRLLGRDVFAVRSARPERTPEAEREIEVGLFDLIQAFQSVLEAAREADAFHEVEVETVTVRDQMLRVMEMVEQRDTIEFMELFGPLDDRPPARGMLVATFLAILELARVFAVRIYQGVNDAGAPEGPIRLRFGTSEDDARPWRERIADHM